MRSPTRGRRPLRPVAVGLAVLLFTETARGQEIIVLPGLAVANRSARPSDGYTARYGPGCKGGTVEWREQLAVFDNPNGFSVNTCLTRGFNYAAGGGLINPLCGAIGSGEEHAYQPAGSRQTWSEIHPAQFTAPGGHYRRIISAMGIWETRQTGAAITSSFGGIYYQQPTGEQSPMLYWQDSTALFLQ